MSTKSPFLGPAAAGDLLPPSWRDSYLPPPRSGGELPTNQHSTKIVGWKLGEVSKCTVRNNIFIRKRAALAVFHFLLRLSMLSKCVKDTAINTTLPSTTMVPPQEMLLWGAVFHMPFHQIEPVLAYRQMGAWEMKLTTKMFATSTKRQEQSHLTSSWEMKRTSSRLWNR
jgi:hypothetical protein